MKRVIVRMHRRYLDQILAIERACFTDPWPPEAFLAELEHGWSRFWLAGPPAPDGGLRVVEGYIICWMLHGDLHLLDLAVVPDSRREGIAKLLLARALREFARFGGGHVNLEVRPSNKAARSLYETFGFSVVGRRKAYYRNDNEDALLMGRVILANEFEGHDRVRTGS